MAACVLATHSAPAQEAALDLQMRSNEPPPAGLVTDVSFAGVSVQDPAGQLRTIAWDRIAHVRGPFAAQAEDFTDIATVAWRARVRLQRGDLPGAEPLLEQLFARYRGQQGATAGLIASGLLRCRLARQAQNAGVEAWLALLASGEPETLFTPARDDADVRPIPVVDGSTGLVPTLPPIFIKGPALQVVLNAIAPGDAGAAARATRLASLYRAAAAFEAGQTVALPVRPAGDWGLELVWDVVASRAGTPEQREQARAGLQRIVTAPTVVSEEQLATPPADATAPVVPPAWTQAWARFALGRLMMQDGLDAIDPMVRDVRALGMVHLLHVPARFDGIAPYLAGLALAEVSAGLAHDGNIDGATRLKRFFLERYPGHPAQSLLPALSVPALSAAQSGVQAPGSGATLARPSGAGGGS